MKRPEPVNKSPGTGGQKRGNRGSEKLTTKMLNKLVGKSIVHTLDKSSGHRRQNIEIYDKAAGIIDIADNLCKAGEGRSQWRKARKSA